MLFDHNLDNIVYERYKLNRCDDIAIISGYVGPAPIEKISQLPIHSTIIYGMYGSDGIGKALHNSLVAADKKYENVDIYYSTVPVHSKIYMWRNHNEVIHALIGSANFSTNGLTTPYKETLAETTSDTFEPLDNYLARIMSTAIRCTEATVKVRQKPVSKSEDKNVIYDANICSMPLYLLEGEIKKMPATSGVNWGMAKLNGSHVNINDAYIPISAEMCRMYPLMFPVKKNGPDVLESIIKKGHRDNDNIDIIWDDGTTMTGLLEGNRKAIVNGNYVEYPKQISTTPHKSELGKYIRSRIGVKEGNPITIEDLEKYGRMTINISLQGEGIYYFDFSV